MRRWQPQGRKQNRVADIPTWCAELADRGGARLVVDAAEGTALGNGPGAGAAVTLLRRVVHLHVRRALRQVLAVVAQAVLGDLDGVEVALWSPLGGQRHS